ncbi:MAG TPA: phosphoglucomutase/phosphomannomutase family protein [Bacteroidia bacterium]|jgi:phosphomannomutase|nr:phosphoglucomutase/phosphomannomutase family protein [Bacteroidia bacterium]
MTELKFGTDGWRAIIAKEFTLDNIARVAEATAQWLLKNSKQPSVVLGHDNRFGGELFAEATAMILCTHGVKVYLAKGFVSTPMVSLGTVKQKADLGIVITASHNPPSYNGFKLKGSYGGPLLPEKTEEIEKLIPKKNMHDLDELKIQNYLENGSIEYIDLETMYCDHLETNFDLDIIRKSRLNFSYDAMYGAGQNVINRLLPDTALLHCENNPSFNGQAPEPIHKNLLEFSNRIKLFENIDCGLATDGDADRLGLYDKKGNFIDSNHIILLLIKYLYEEKEMRGKVVTSFSVSAKVGKLCEHYGLEHEVTKIGFKHIAGLMISEDVLLGGEESGGIAIKGHIPERDGIWIGLTIWECMAVTGKSLHELIKDVYAIVGPFSFERSDMHIQENLKNEIIKNCKKNIYKSFGEYKIKRTENLDGYKYFFDNDEWLMIRASGTEPVLRNYVESSCPKKTNSILKAAEQTLLGKMPLNNGVSKKGRYKNGNEIDMTHINDRPGAMPESA